MLNLCDQNVMQVWSSVVSTVCLYCLWTI